MHLGSHHYSRVELLTSKGAEKTTVASAADCEVEADSLTAGHERKHNACRAELEVVLVGSAQFVLCMQAGSQSLDVQTGSQSVSVQNKQHNLAQSIYHQHVTCVH